MPIDDLLDDLANAVLDGAPVDWDAAESSAAPAERRLVRQLRMVSAIAGLQQPAILDEWGHLRLLERIGQGAFGDVFRAWDTRLDREVALKLSQVSPGHDLDGTVIREGRLLAKVRHPNVVTIYGAERIGDRVGLWMEFVRGVTLEQELRASGPFDERAIVATGIEICQAVSAVHQAGLLHRDIKAHNVMRSHDGRVVLMDFGAGRELGDDPSSDRTGTPLYAAREVLAGGEATVTSDVYSLGVLLYHLATQSYPVAGATLAEVRRAHERREHADIRIARPDLSRTVARTIDRAIDPRPEHRYQSADALLHDLTALERRRAAAWLRYGLAAATAAVLALLVAGRPAPAPGRVEQLRYNVSDDAYRLYERARALKDERSERARLAIPMLQQVIRSAPSFAPAHAALAATYGYLAIDHPTAENYTIPPREAARAMAPIIRDALALAPDEAEAHAARGTLYAIEGRWADAESSYRFAISRDPGLAAIYGDFALSTLIPWGRLDEAEAVLEDALARNPASVDIRRMLARVQLSAGRPDEAIANLTAVLQGHPSVPFARNILLWAHFARGDRAETLRQLSELSAGRPGIRAFMHAIEGQRAEAEAIAATFGHLPQRQAEIYALLGDRERAFEALDRLAAINPIRAGYELTRAELGMRGDPRAAMLRRKLGFPEM